MRNYYDSWKAPECRHCSEANAESSQKISPEKKILAHESAIESISLTDIFVINLLVKIEEPEDNRNLNPKWGMKIG